MKKLQTCLISSCVLAGGLASFSANAASSLTEALTSGKAYGNFRLRYEDVSQDNAVKDASALTLRTRLGYKTGSVGGFSALIEFEDSRIVAGEDEFTVGPTGFNPGEYSVIADPETTEVDQAFIQYKNNVVTAKLGAQVITLDNHRFVGHVGWRQDRQTFDALSVKLTPAKGLDITYANIFERNRIFAEAADQKSSDNLLNVGYKTSIGKLSGYAYLLEPDDDITRDTYGLRFAGSSNAGGTKLLYTAEVATQEFDNGTTDFDADYGLLEFGAVISGVTIKAGYELLGSDDGAYGFSTPLATLHKFNGWADQFLATPVQGLEDVYLLASTKVGPGKLTVVYHEFSADESTSTVDDLGSEIDVAYAMTFGKHYFAGVKYADYSAEDIKVDAEKLWAWVGLKF